MPTAGGRARPGLRVHRRPGLPTCEATTDDGIPCTSVPRTLLDLAAILRPHQLDQAIERAEELRRPDIAHVDAVLIGNRGRRGTRALRTGLSHHRPDQHTVNDLEAGFRQLCRRSRLPEPETNAWLTLPSGRAIRPDAMWREHRLIAELDGFSTHGTRTAFESDRERDAEPLVLGWRVLRLTWRRLRDEPAVVAARVQALLRRAA